MFCLFIFNITCKAVVYTIVKFLLVMVYSNLIHFFKNFANIQRFLKSNDENSF